MKKILFGCVAMSFVAWLIIREQSNEVASHSMWGAKQQAGGGIDKLKGKAKEVLGDSIGDDSMSTEGMVDQALGAVRAGVGKVVSTFHNAGTPKNL